MPSPWTHLCCDDCWNDNFRFEGTDPNVGLGRDPVRMRSAESGRCCWCGNDTSSGIFRRADPKTLYCEGQHDGR